MKRGLLLAVGLLAALTAYADQPNIVVILADDMGYGDCGACTSESKIKTPHIDQLAREGLLLSDAHSAASTCTPSRYGLLTGVNPARTGVLNTLLSKGNPIIAEDETTIASLLKDQGYITKMIGKWHLGFEMDKSSRKPTYDLAKPLKGGPVDRGFDSFYGIPSSPGSSPLCYIRGRKVEALPTERTTVEKVRGEKTTRVNVTAAPGFVPEEVSPSFCREAIEILREHAASKDPRPLFLYYASPVPHQPWVPIRAFRGKSGLGLYGDFVMQLDDVVGQINSALKETGLDRNTLLIFTSDNGAGPWAVKAMDAFGHASSGPLRGRKSDAWEGGHRVPFIAKWPGRIPAGNRSDATVNFTDLFATFAELLGVDPTKAYPGSAEDSFSFLPVLLAPSKKHQRPAMINGRHAIREGDWKLIADRRHEDAATIGLPRFGLYNLADDLAERNDVSDAHAERTQRLFRAYKDFVSSRKLK
ncbi:MAG: arylsulfatase [Lentisphaerae bacterium]|jgi:arylsulfatase A|nr:arylsulfatase [Lentisphaerota bacterium]MBT4819209.1 arylsulfatase [Lentisphaerota bacterium]MBT5609781.1 arylsulfatase [Lentisphaerota bacterium]MBT7062093.1 arylsulfatase [Lentisphaerota bacterium]MBT7847311.1 arylsulfatase [Lentisphaerota bacterium]